MYDLCAVSKWAVSVGWKLSQNDFNPLVTHGGRPAKHNPFANVVDNTLQHGTFNKPATVKIRTTN